MEIIKDLEAKQEILHRIESHDFQNRAGIHQSDLVFCLNKALLRRTCPKPASESTILRWGRGLASQRWLSDKLEDEPTIELDGIQVTPDALWSDGNPWELKDTDQSNAKGVEENIHYIRQLLNQCKVLGKTTARLSRMCNMGNWKWVYRPKDPIKILALVDEFGQDWDAHPTLDVTRFEFTQAEVDANWEQMKMRRGILEGMLVKKTPVPKVVAQMSGMEWECKDCEYRGKECPSS